MAKTLTGSAFVIKALIDHTDDKATPRTARDLPVPREDGPHDTYRCAKCQTAVWTDCEHRPNLRYIRVGTLDEPGALEPDAHTFTRWEAKWLQLPEGTPSLLKFYEPGRALAQASVERLDAALGITR